MVRPEILTVIPVPTCSWANVPAAEVLLRVNSSPDTLFTSAADVVLIVAVVSESYVLLSAVMPDTVRGLAVILAVVEAVTVKL